jgi:hypothetical protein
MPAIVGEFTALRPLIDGLSITLTFFNAMNSLEINFGEKKNL